MRKKIFLETAKAKNKVAVDAKINTKKKILVYFILISYSTPTLSGFAFLIDVTNKSKFSSF